MRYVSIVGVILLTMMFLPLSGETWKSATALAGRVSLEYPMSWVVDMNTDTEFDVSNHDEEALFPEALSLSYESISEEDSKLSLDQFVDDSVANMTRILAGNVDDSSHVDGRTTIKSGKNDVCLLDLSLKLEGVYHLKAGMLICKLENKVIFGLLTYDADKAEINSETFKRLMGSITIN